LESDVIYNGILRCLIFITEHTTADIANAPENN